MFVLPTAPHSQNSGPQCRWGLVMFPTRLGSEVVPGACVGGTLESSPRPSALSETGRNLFFPETSLCGSWDMASEECGCLAYLLSFDPTWECLPLPDFSESPFHSFK